MDCLVNMMEFIRRLGLAFEAWWFVMTTGQALGVLDVVDDSTLEIVEELGPVEEEDVIPITRISL